MGPPEGANETVSLPDESSSRVDPMWQPRHATKSWNVSSPASPNHTFPSPPNTANGRDRTSLPGPPWMRSGPLPPRRLSSPSPPVSSSMPREGSTTAYAELTCWAVLLPRFTVILRLVEAKERWSGPSASGSAIVARPVRSASTR